MSQSLKVLLAFIFAIILAVILTPFLGRLYDYYFTVSGGFFWGPSHPEYIPGFIIAYLFFIPLFIISLLEKKKIMWLLIGIFPIIAIGLGELRGGGIILGPVVFIIGGLLGLLSSKLAKIGEKN